MASFVFEAQEGAKAKRMSKALPGPRALENLEPLEFILAFFFRDKTSEHDPELCKNQLCGWLMPDLYLEIT